MLRTLVSCFTVVTIAIPGLTGLLEHALRPSVVTPPEDRARARLPRAHVLADPHGYSGLRFALDTLTESVPPVRTRQSRTGVGGEEFPDAVETGALTPGWGTP